MEDSSVVQVQRVSPGALAPVNDFATFFVFLDLPKHVEFRASSVPLLNVGDEVEFDLTIRSLKDPKRSIPISGLHRVERRFLKFGGKRPGFSQYIEWRLIRSGV